MTRRRTGRVMMALGVGLLVLPLFVLALPAILAPTGTSVDFVGGPGLPLCLLAALALIATGAGVYWKSGS